MMRRTTEVTPPRANDRPLNIAALLFGTAAVVAWFAGAVFKVLNGLSGLAATSENGPPFDDRYWLPGLVLTSVVPFAIGGLAFVLGLIGRRRALQVAGASRMATAAVAMGAISSSLGLLGILIDVYTGQFDNALSLL